MKRAAVILSVVLMFFFAMATTAEAHCICVSKLNMKLLSQDVYSWELAKSCNVEDPVELGVGDSVDLTYTVSATRSKPQTVRTVEVSARVVGATTARVTYNKETREVAVVDGYVREVFPYACGVKKFSVKAGCLTRTYRKLLLPTVKMAKLGSTATLGDGFACTPDGLIVKMSDEFAAKRTLDSCKRNSYQFEYTVTVTNQSSFGQTHTLTNTALLEYGDGSPLEESTSVVLTTPEKMKEPEEPVDPDDPEEPDEPTDPKDPADPEEPGDETIVEPEEPKLEPEPEAEPKKKAMPRTDGVGGVLGLIGMLMTTAGILFRRVS